MSGDRPVGGDRPPGIAGTTAFLLIGAGRRLEEELEGRLAEHGLTLRHVGVLGHLRRDPGISVSELARRSRITVQSMHTVVRALTARGAIAAQEAVSRGRAARLEVTAEGEALLAAARAAAEAIDTELLADVPPALRPVLLGVAMPGLNFQSD